MKNITDDTPAVSVDEAEQLGAFAEDALSESDVIAALEDASETPVEAMREAQSQG